MLAFHALYNSHGISQVDATFLAMEEKYQRSGSDGVTEHSEKQVWCAVEELLVCFFKLSILLGCPIDAPSTEHTLTFQLKLPGLHYKTTETFNLHHFKLFMLFEIP